VHNLTVVINRLNLVSMQLEGRFHEPFEYMYRVSVRGRLGGGSWYIHVLDRFALS
jgi:hypothetical protein